VVIYDDLGAQAAVERYVPPSAERIFVGKRGGRPSPKQPEIDAAIVAAAAAGRTVVRLKGGCPSVFSRVRSAGGVGCQPGRARPATDHLQAGCMRS
jgi:siroheme synthase